MPGPHPQAKNSAGVVPSFPGETEAQGRRLVWQLSSQSWDPRAHRAPSSWEEGE